MSGHMHPHKLCAWSFGLSGGITWGLWLFFISAAALQFGWWQEGIGILSSFYAGYDATWMGAFKGLFWGFIEGFLFGLVFALIYNCIFCCCFSRKCCSKEGGEGESKGPCCKT